MWPGRNFAEDFWRQVALADLLNAAGQNWGLSAFNPTGLEVCRTLKSDPATAGITIVMLTARAQDSDREAGRAAGAESYFTKPFSPVALLRKVDEIFSGSQGDGA